MDSWRKKITICFIVLLALSIVASLSFKPCVAELNSKYAGTQSVNQSLDFHCTIILSFTCSQEFERGVLVGMDRYSDAFLHSVSYKASWQPTSLIASYYDPANRNDDDPNPKRAFKVQ